MPEASRVSKPGSCAPLALDGPGKLFLWFPEGPCYEEVEPLLERLVERRERMPATRGVVLSLASSETVAALDCLATLLDPADLAAIESLFLPGLEEHTVFDFSQVQPLSELVRGR